MQHYPYLIVGGGMTGAAAVEAIREVDPQARVGVIGAESDKPYQRPPLTKALWFGKKQVDDIWIKPGEENVEYLLGHTVTSIDPANRKVRDEQGNEYGYDKLLLATGGTPAQLPFGGDQVLYYRTLNDYQTLRDWAGQGHTFAVLGGGFIGSELAAALTMNGEKVIMFFPEEGIGARMFPAGLSRNLNAYYREKGVDVRAGQLVTELHPRGGRFVLRTRDGQEVEVDHVVAGLGIRPNVELAQSAGLDVDNGIVVDEHLRTSQPDIYASGDVANFYDAALGKRRRVEHEDNANTSGAVAGQNMAGQDTPYNHQPFFYSDLFDLGYEAVGDLNSRLETFSDWQEPFRKGVVYYLQDGRVRGVLLWNTWDQVDAARRLIAEDRKFTREELKGRLPE